MGRTVSLPAVLFFLAALPLQAAAPPGVSYDKAFVSMPLASTSTADLQRAQEQGVHAALTVVLHDFAQAQIDAQTWTEETPVIDHFLRLRAPQYVIKYSVDNKRIEYGRSLSLSVGVWLRGDDLRAALLSELAQPAALVVLVTPDQTAQQADARALWTSLNEALLAGGYATAAPDRLTCPRWRSRFEAALHEDRAAMRALSLGFLAPVVVRLALKVRPSQNNAGIITAAASADLAAVRTQDSTLVFAHHFPEEKGFGQSLEQARQQAVEKLTAAVAEYTTARVALLRSQGLRDISVTSETPLSAEQWAQVGAELQKSPLVRQVQPGNGSLTCRIEGSALLVADVADRIAGFQVVSCDLQTIRIAVRA